MDARMGDAPRCSICGNFVGMRPLLPPVRVELELWGCQYGDVAFGPGEILFSEEFSKLFSSSGLTGLVNGTPAHIQKVVTHQRTKARPIAYNCFQIVRSRAAVDEVASRLIREEPWRCEECRIGGVVERAERVILEPNSWSGEDIFTPRGLPGTILVSEKFARFCHKHEFRTCNLIPAEQFHFDLYRFE
jgi:hypothetical protein